MSINLFELGLSYHQNGDYEQAEKIYQQLLELDPENANVLHVYGILSAQRGNLQQALDLITAALEIQPNSPTFENSMGNVLWYLEDFDKAIEHYERSIKLEPNAPVAHNNLGNLYLKQEQYQKAINHYHDAIALKPNYPEAYYNLGIILEKLGRRQEAITNFKKVLEYEPKFPEALGQLGQLLQMNNNYSEAINYYQQRLNLEPADIETLVNLGGVLVKQGDLLQGVEYFQKALALQPLHLEALYNLGSTYLSLQKPDEALEQFLKCANERPDVDTLYNIAVIYMFKDQYREAIDFFNAVLSLAPKHLESHINLGATFLKIEDYTKAIEHYQKALEIQPKNEELQYLLAAITQQKNAPTSAPQEFIANLYDQYAAHFEKHLLNYLHYQAHTKLYEALQPYLEVGLKYKIIDLGCGTGLCGALFKDYAKEMIGVDLSPKMLNLAAKKNIYDQLLEMDLVAALQQLTDIDLVLAADVFGYVGDLAPVFAAASKGLKNKGYFAFTVEKTEGSSFVLQKTTRFAHSKEYVQKLCKQFSFKICSENELQLRTQRQQPVEGYLYILQKQ